MLKEEKFMKWEEIVQKGTAPPKLHVWTDDNERALIEASRMISDVSDMALGCSEASKKVDFARTARKFTQEEWDAMTAARAGLESADAPRPALEINPVHNYKLGGKAGGEEAV